ncbi:GNAT family protein [Sphingobium sp.]|uniref:GNAT family N-acetyltransferase n=1 Tax=Sphingobium sp. TaxID=1912891 RepID=UPI002CBA0498|nr:GNAT family protein [Sphingobium sp.]HUD92052.1 GNAT family protein [Sphingobium sp.]
MSRIDRLLAPIKAPGLHLEQLREGHREALRAICPVDDPVWEIFPSRWAAEDFDAVFDATIANPDRCPFLIRADGAEVGMSGYLHLNPADNWLELGGTYMTPVVRGTGLNGRIKPLLIGRAIDCGFTRIEFRIDRRNIRSQKAVEKLGAVCEGVLRQQRVTWTGHIRDTVIYSILADEWRARTA